VTDLLLQNLTMRWLAGGSNSLPLPCTED